MLPPHYLSVVVLANKAHGSQNDTGCNSDRQELVRDGNRQKKLDPKINRVSLMLGLFGTVTKTRKHSLGSLSFCILCTRNAFVKGCCLQQTIEAARPSFVPCGGWTWKCLQITGRLPSPARHMLPAQPTVKLRCSDLQTRMWHSSQRLPASAASTWNDFQKSGSRGVRGWS